MSASQCHGSVIAGACPRCVLGAALLPLLLLSLPTAQGQEHFEEAFRRELHETCHENRSLSDELKKNCEAIENLDKQCYNKMSDTCPPDCAVIVRLCGAPRCARPVDCKLQFPSGYIENTTKTCTRQCNVMGCDTCESDGNCKKCEDSFELEDGKCWWKWRLFGWAMVVITGCLGVYMVVSMICVHWRVSRTRNSKALEAGLLSRYRAKVNQYFKPDCPKYPLTANMHCHKKGRVPICGPGMTLFMNWFGLTFAVGAWLSILAFYFADEPSPCVVQAEALLQDVKHYPLWAGFSYIGSTIISFAFFLGQRVLWTRMTHDNKGEVPVQSYTVMALGFPPHATDKAKLLQFFQDGLKDQHLPPDVIEYISIAYDYSEADDPWVTAAIDRHLQEAQQKFENLSKGAEGSAAPRGSEGRRSSTTAKSGLPLWMRFVARVMFGKDADGGSAAMDIEERDLHESLESLKNSGDVFIVLKTQAMAIAMQSFVHMPHKYEGRHVIRLKLAEEAPQLIYWGNFSVSKKTKVWRGAVGALILLATALFWFICYGPTAAVYRMSASADGNILIEILSYVASITVIIGNAVIGYVVVWITEWIGFKRQGPLLLTRLWLIVPLMLLNVMFDTYWAIWEPSIKAFSGDGNSTKAHITLVKQLHDMALELLGSYCLIPYFGEPLCCILLVFLLGMWTVQANPRITPQQAERILVAQTTDIVNPPYADIICTSTIIMVTFLISPSPTHKRIFPWLLVFTVVLYINCRLRVLRWESRSYYGTRSLHDTEAKLWALPLALLAAAWERNLYEANSIENGHFSMVGYRFFLMHVMMHNLFLMYVLPTVEPQMPTSTQTYKEVQRRLQGHACLADFLNTNPIEVLKSHQCPELCTSRALTYYRMDKEHLQERAVKDFQGEVDYAHGMDSPLRKLLSSEASAEGHELLRQLKHPQESSDSGSDETSSVASFDSMR